MRLCDRCGVEFDSPGQWCEDCLEAENTTDIWSRQGNNPEALMRKAEVIKDLWLNGLSDPQIAKRLGIRPYSVLRWRKRLNLPATNHGGFSMMSPANQKASLALLAQTNVKKGRDKCSTTHDTSEATKK